jgi:hypothetical protein
MLLRNRLPFLIALLSLLATSCSRAVDSPDDAAAEAQRLYDHANAYVTNIQEGAYSYAYQQFYWKRAQANVERALRVYPETPIGRQLRAGELKVGPFELEYFRERVLPRLELKRLSAFDAVNCAILLYNLDETRWDAARLDALASILEVLARQKRFSEALAYPVRDEDRLLKLKTIFRIAAHFGQQDVVEQILADAEPEDLPELWPLVAEGIVLLGRPREELVDLLDEHPEDRVKLAALTRLVDREILIQRSAALRLDVKDGIQTTHFPVLKPEIRDDVVATAREFFPRPTAAATEQLLRLRAGLGERPPADAPVSAHVAFLDFLTDMERFDDLAAYLPSLRPAESNRRQLELKLIELWARANRLEESNALLRRTAAAGGPLADRAALAQFRGRMESRANPLTVRERTFVDLPIGDPCILAQAIMEWSLTPNRSIRGAAPYDAVIGKYLPGFDNLPLPEDDAVAAAAAASPLY